MMMINHFSQKCIIIYLNQNIMQYPYYVKYCTIFNLEIPRSRWMVYARYRQLSYKPYMMYSKPCLKEVQFQNFGHLLRVARGTSLHRQLLVLFASRTIVVDALLEHPASYFTLPTAGQEVSPAPCIVHLIPPVKLPSVLADPGLLTVLPISVVLDLSDMTFLRQLACLLLHASRSLWQCSGRLEPASPLFRPRYLAGICFAMFLH